MASLTDLEIYRDLADRYESLQQPTMRDRFLLLAADAALNAGRVDQAERLRERILAGNPDHLLRPYRSFLEARQSADVQTYLRDLRLNYPPDRAREMLASLNNTDEGEPVVLQPPASEQRPFPRNAPVRRSESPLSQTAPHLDLNTPAPRPSWKPTAAIPLVPDTDHPAARPRAQPVPYPPPVEPTRALRPARVDRAASASATYPQSATTSAASEAPLPSGAWFAFLLAGIAAMAAFLVALFTLARPFLPPEWLP